MTFRKATLSVICILGAVVSVAGCTSFIEDFNRGWAEEQERQKAAEKRRIEALADGIAARCKAYGFKKGTDGWAGCVEREAHRVAAEETAAQRRQEAADRAYWQDYDRRQREAFAPPRSKSSTTNCSGYGTAFSCRTTAD